MGVQGLDSLLEKHRNIYREVRFGRSRLLVDGCSLYHQLYFSSGLDQNHGGEYAAYETLVESFIAALRSCDITPYVVLDGGSAHFKAQTAVQRATARILRKHQPRTSGEQSNVLPKLAELVFTQTLARLQVPLAQCFAEADQEIAALASEWRCPVLSNDSDFLVFDLPAGFLPIGHFQWREVRQSGSQSSISCWRYYASSFCGFFGLRPRLLPTFAALAGNDYVKLRGIDWTRFVRAGAGREACGRLEGLLCWLKGFEEPQEALEEVLGLTEDLSGDRQELLQRLRLGMEEYQLGRSALSRFFLHGAPPEFPALQQEADLVPSWMLLPLTQARLSGKVLDVLRLHRMILGSAIETQELPSANRTSRPLRQVMYGLLLGRDKFTPVEFDREGLTLISVPVEPTFTRTSERLRLDSLPQVALSDRRDVLLEALGVTQESLRLLPPQLQLPAAVTCYWLQKAQPPPDLQRALLLGMSNRLRSGAAFHNKSGIQKVDVNVSHVFSQWQACLKDSIHLNQLLGLPLPEPDVSRLYQGTLVHQLVHRMRSGGKLKSLLRSDRPSEEPYRALLSVVRRVPAASGNRPKAATRQRRDPQEPSADLRRLFLRDEETESETRAAVAAQEELRLQEEPVRVRTRYRTKERRNRSKNPDLARKEESRGRDLL